MPQNDELRAELIRFQQTLLRLQNAAERIIDEIERPLQLFPGKKKAPQDAKA